MQPLCGGSRYEVLVGKREGKRALIRLKLRWEGNAKMYLEGTEEGCGD
jgi:hypothetical protein